MREHGEFIEVHDWVEPLRLCWQTACTSFNSCLRAWGATRPFPSTALQHDGEAALGRLTER
jgi:hypothetical protein